MIIQFLVSDLLVELFPHTKGDREALIAAMKKHHMGGGVEPTITIENELVTIHYDEQRIAGVEQAFNEAWKDCEKGRFDVAKPKLLKLAAQAPANSNVQGVLGQVHYELGEYDEAMDRFIEALRWDPTNLRALIMMGNLWARQKEEPDTALTYYREAHRLQPTDHIAATNIGGQLVELERYQEAEPYLASAIEHAPDYPNARHAMAMVQRELGNSDRAFEEVIAALQHSSGRGRLHEASMQLASEMAQQFIHKETGREIVQRMTEALATRAGKPVVTRPDDALTTAAKLEVAETHGRNEHRLVYRPGFPAVEHLELHELYHLRMILDARQEAANQLFTSNDSHLTAFRTSVADTARKLRKEGVADEAVGRYIDALFKGFLLQIYNAPLDLFIEFDMHREHPGIRPYQFLSLGRMVHEAVQASTSPQALTAAPPAVASASKVYNATLALVFKELYGVDRVPDLKCTPKEVQLANKLYDEFKEYRNDRQPGEEYELVEHWAKDLQLEKFFALVPEERRTAGDGSLADQLNSIEADPIGDYSADPEKVREMQDFQARQKELGVNMAVVMYMVDALKHFKAEPMNKIKMTAFEIAMLGAQGIHPEKQGYKLANVPGTTFSGYRLLAYYYVSFKLAVPEVLPDLKLPYDTEFGMAEQLYSAAP